MNEDIVLTPMMKQFLDLKAKHPDAVMLFRCGDFYETYSTDAIVASEILGITLTKRANGKEKTIEMAGFPYHALDTYLPKLIRAGKRVAICDQLEDPKLTKKLVKRGITELVTPGVSINDNVLNYRENNFLAAVHFGKGACGVAFLDISTGEFLTAEGPFDYIDKLLNNFGPKEVLFERGKRPMFEGNFGSKFFTFELDDWVFTESTAREKLLKHFEVKNLKGFGVEHLKNGIIASGAILQYLIMTQHTQIGHITSLARIEEDKYVRLDKFTVRSLELMGSMNEGGSSLLSVIDRTICPMGARLMKRWLVFPLKDVRPINDRLDVVEERSNPYWILNKNKKARVVEQNGEVKRYRNREREILFMDLRQMGSPYEKKYIELTEEDRAKVTDVYHAWQQEGYEETYHNVPEFCYSASFEEVAEKGFTLVPSRYIEFVNRDEAIDFDTKMKTLQAELKELLAEEEKSKADLLAVFKELGYEIKL